MSLSGGLCPWGIFVQGGSLSNTCENITLPQTSFAGSNECVKKIKDATDETVTLMADVNKASVTQLNQFFQCVSP